jgi:hypothetical protein
VFVLSADDFEEEHAGDELNGKQQHWRADAVSANYGFCPECKRSSKSYPLRCPECKRELPRLKKHQRRAVFLLALGFTSYKAYLASNLWKDIRAKAMEDAGGKCARCGNDADQVHHTEYSFEALRGDCPKSLVALCRGCHKFIEFHPDGRKARQGTANAKLRGEYDPSRKHRSRPEIGRYHAQRQAAKRKRKTSRT